LKCVFIIVYSETKEKVVTDLLNSQIYYNRYTDIKYNRIQTLKKNADVNTLHTLSLS